MLHALAQGISRSGEPESIDEVILLCDLIIESNDNYNLLECYVSKLVTMNCNPQTSRIFDKLLTQANKGCITVKGPTVLLIFQKDTNLLDTWCQNLLKTPTDELSGCWLLKISSRDALLYQLVCENLLKNHPKFLPEFIEHVQMTSNIIPLYTREEQPCVMLLTVKLPEDVDITLKMFHIKKVMKELYDLWVFAPVSVLKLIDHFPVLVEWMVNYCDGDYHIQSLCLDLINQQSLKTCQMFN